MKLKALDQTHISAVRADAISEGEVFEVSDSMGNDLLRKLPALFERADQADEPVEKKAEPKVDAKAEVAPLNKAEDAPANKAVTRRNTKAK